MVVSRHIEGIFDVFKALPAGGGGLDQHDIEPAGAIAKMVPGQVLRCQLNQLFAFLFMHRFDRPAEFMGAPSLDFDKHQHHPVLRYKIQFAERGTKISADDAIALLSEVLLGRRLSFLPNESSWVNSAH
jgi:hypothetical protein